MSEWLTMLYTSGGIEPSLVLPTSLRKCSLAGRQLRKKQSKSKHAVFVLPIFRDNTFLPYHPALLSSDVTAGRAAGLPGRQLVDITAAIFGPDDDFVCGYELTSSPGLVALTRY